MKLKLMKNGFTCTINDMKDEEQTWRVQKEVPSLTSQSVPVTAAVIKIISHHGDQELHIFIPSTSQLLKSILHPSVN